MISKIIQPSQLTSPASLQSIEELKKSDPSLSGLTNSKKQSGFAEMVSQGIQSVNHEMNEATKVSESFMMGEKKYDIHEVMISLEKADLSFRYMAQVRNKVLDAYNEVMRMQV
ncbi:MAG: flagellar hook-basal body complex protein FliE [Deltaproteobacteria bacterium]|nr:MAG: flagellar hook-basal body complex protein FliE [Deltaproteobacteria bacterium]